MFRISLLLLGLTSLLRAEAPIASYIFPPGGQRGTTVKVRVGGLNLYERCPWELKGRGLSASSHLLRIPTRWIEGPLLPIPDSQRSEDYPQDMQAEIRIASDASLGSHRGRLWTSEGVSSGLIFFVGELPEIVEDELNSADVVSVKLPVTINGRIYPREDIDVWSFAARKGQIVTATVQAASLGSPLDSRLEIRDSSGNVIAENEDYLGTDSLLSLVIPADDTYSIRIHDSNRGGGQQHVYRLTLTHEPHVEAVFPAGGRGGSKVKMHLVGPGIANDPVEVSLPASSAGTQIVKVTMPDGKVVRVPVDIDSLPEVQNSGETSMQITPPVVCNGRIDRPGKEQRWRFTAKKGQTWTIDLRAAVLGSSLRGVIEICDATGKLLRKVEPSAKDLDSSFSFAVPNDGEYEVRIRDRYRRRGGVTFPYRLRITDQPSDFHLHLATDALTLERGKTAKVKLSVKREGTLNSPIQLTAKGLPEGVTFKPDRIAPGQTNVDLIVSAKDTVVIGPVRLQLHGAMTHGGKTLTRTATLADDPSQKEILLAIALKAPFKLIGTYDLRLAPRGTVFRKKYRIERNGYSGPLEIRLADRQNRHLQGVSGPVLKIAADVNDFEYPVTLPPWMETGRTSRACVMAIGKIREAGVEHTVSYSSQAQNDQIIAVVETGLLGVELGRSSLAIQPGKSAEISVSIRRSKGLLGAVQIECVEDRDLIAQPLTIAAEKEAGILRLTANKGCRSKRVTIRARLKTEKGDVIAETELDIVAPEK